MKQIFRIALSLVIISLCVSSCKEDAIILPDPYFRNYFPAKVGSYITYSCDSIVFNDFTDVTDTFRFLIKEKYVEEFTDNSGRPAIKIERWKKPDTSSWYLKDIWYLVKTDAQIEKVEEDVRYLKMMYPVRLGNNWNYNALNFEESLNVEYKDSHVSFTNGTLSWDSTTTVESNYPNNLINQFTNTETFAMNVGLVYKHFLDKEMQNNSSGTGLEVKRLVDFTMNAIEVGVE